MGACVPLPKWSDSPLNPGHPFMNKLGVFNMNNEGRKIDSECAERVGFFTSDSPCRPFRKSSHVSGFGEVGKLLRMFGRNPKHANSVQTCKQLLEQSHLTGHHARPCYCEERMWPKLPHLIDRSSRGLPEAFRVLWVDPHWSRISQGSVPPKSGGFSPNCDAANQPGNHGV